MLRAAPGSIHVPWTDLLAKRALLNEHLRSFAGADEFVARMLSSRLGGVLQTEATIDRALSALQRGFECEGYRLEMEFPEFERKA